MAVSQKTDRSDNISKDPMLYYPNKEQEIKKFLKRFKNPTSSNPDLNINMFQCYRTLGEGSFGRVVLSYCGKYRKFYALKLLCKEKLVKQNQIEHTMNEKQILFACKHPNIVKVYFLFKDNSYLYFGIQYVVGGDLYLHLKTHQMFKETTARFYISQILSCFDYLHSLNCVYRDLKPENILITSKGYLKLVDFGFAKRIEGRTYTLCGM
jgi:protein kinase A